jgi:HlyD family secretion protein
MKVLSRKLVPIIVLLLVAAGLIYAFWPAPVEVDVEPVTRGPMQVTVDEDGQTRIRERYVVASPLAGRLRRIDLKEGDPVEDDVTVLAVIEPVDPSLLDARAEAEAQARVKLAEAAVERAKANLARAEAMKQHEADRLEDIRNAHERKAASDRELEAVVTEASMAASEALAAAFTLDVSKFELEQARSALIRTRREGPSVEPLEIRSPITGRVLRVPQESEAVVTPGQPLIELGDPNDLEVIVDVLSPDAVNIKPGATVLLEHWGGEGPLHARVRLVEPSGFTKISALGVEEQRVNVIADFVDQQEASAIGDGYRVEARIVVWDRPDPPGVVRVPAGALFRRGEGWAVFVMSDGRAELRDVHVDKHNGHVAEVIDGLTEGDHVIMYPSDRVSDGARVALRVGN